MACRIIKNGDVDTRSLIIDERFSRYLKEIGAVYIGKTENFQEYRIASGLTREAASTRLCGIAGDMLELFDIDPTPVIPHGNSRLEFANQVGIFYIDNLVS